MPSPRNTTAGTLARLPLLSQMVTRVLALVLTWETRHRNRLHLERLDERLLRDIGLDQTEAEDEIAKPFWRA